MSSRPISVGVLALLLVAAYQLLLIAGHHGNPTVLFYAGAETPAPPALQQSLYRFPNSVGFDGQFYLFIAHDPWNAHGVAAFVDNPSMRWRRILLPGMAWMLSGGSPSLLPFAWMGLMGALAVAGTVLSGMLLRDWGYPVWCGIGFLAIPAVVVSLDRMLTDIALVVALLAWLWAIQRDHHGVAMMAMALAPLARETGMVLAAAWFLWRLIQQDARRALWAPLALLPFLTWTAWVHQQFGADATRWWGWPLEGILTRLAHYAVYPAPSLGLKLALLLDYAGALGIAAALLLALPLWLRNRSSLLLLTSLLYAAGICCFAKADMWSEAYSYTRTGGPVALLLTLYALEQRRWWLLAPLAFAVPRIAFQIGLSVLESLRGLGG
ncbi:MAG: hypothetical protein MUF01_09630 [Bryobacterales bacterium]|jgi:hypothetical protein|nr:hypothetical protein [Bryobacterales bacterium]